MVWNISRRWQLLPLLALVTGNLGSAPPLAAASLHQACSSCAPTGHVLLRASSPFIVSCDATHMMAILVISCVVRLEAGTGAVAGISLYMAYLRWWPPAVDSIRKALYESPTSRRTLTKFMAMTSRRS